jgi:predicted dehydrogenase
MSNPVTAVIVGAGHRALTYAAYSKHRPDELKIVGVADPMEYRRRYVAELYGLRPDQCFETAEELAAGPQIADAVINGTMDQQHVPTSLPLLNAGYHLLLEKPFAVNESEMWDLLAAARKNDRKVMICHVMRYAPFSVAMKRCVARGDIGEIISVQTLEHVSYHHMAVGYVRGKWNRKDLCGSPMLMAKCCHDLDFITWMKSGIAPVRVSSFGCNMQFRPEKAPEGAGTRCLVDCPIEESCLYSARKHYIDHPQRWSFYVWAGLEQMENPTIEDKIHSLKTDNPYGRCVWKCDNDVVDHQSVMIEFEDGSTATHNMVGGASKPMRSIHLVGTIGELQGVLHDSRFVLRHIDPRPGHEYSEEVIDVDVKGDMDGAFGGHAGGDGRLAADFIRFIRGEEPSISCTSIEDSIRGHLIGFRADVAMEEGRVVEIPTDW